MTRDSWGYFRRGANAHASRREFLKGSVSAAVLASVHAKPPLLHAMNSYADEASRSPLADDPLRPQVHLLPAKNWMNDPNGPIYWKGHYHMFFQYNPNAAVWGDVHWAHAISADMIHWRHLPIALAPTPGWEDADGCFTGSAIDDNGVATIVYTGVKTSEPDRATLRDGVHNFREVLCLATSNDAQLRNWTKWKDPVLQPPEDPRLTGFRDPFLWRDAATWYVGIGAGLRQQGGQVLLYRSRDLRQWEYLHPLAAGKWTGQESVNPVDSGEMWECPDFFPLGTKHVLLYSTAGKVTWETGVLDRKELVFHPQKCGILDHGAYYAQKTQLDPHGNRILWGWIPETRPEPEFREAGWAGCMALPRVLSIGSDGDLGLRVASEVRSLRGKAFALPKGGSSPSARTSALQTFRIENVAGEIAWKINTAAMADASCITFTLADHSGPWVSVSLEGPQGAPGKLTINDKSIDLPRGTNPERECHLFLDASVAELICDQKHAITTRIYRKPDGPLRVELANSDLRDTVSLEAWQLRPISPDRLTSAT
jgi:beta-fructofuranosidase